MKIENILEKLIKFNTVADKENDKMTSWIGNFLSQLGFKVSLISNDKNNKKNFFATIGKKPILTFLGHTDTVPAGENWTTDPFKMKINGDKIYGLGSSDMKGGIASLLSALSQINFKNCKQGLSILLTYDEEVNFSGIKDFTKNKKINTKYIIVGEPTNLKPIVACKGIVSFVLIFFGKECHGSEPEKGINAIFLACDFILNIPRQLAAGFPLRKGLGNRWFPKIFQSEAPKDTPPSLRGDSLLRGVSLLKHQKSLIN